MKTKYIAHRGFSAKNMQNTIEAFKYAAKSNAYGIETNVHITKDGRFVVYHDDSTFSLCGEEKIIEDIKFGALKNIKINDTFTNTKVAIPTLSEYLEICKTGNKQAVVALKNPFTRKNIGLLVEEIKKAGYLDKTTFISFDIRNIVILRELLPEQELQYITLTYDLRILEILANQKIDLDIEFGCLSKERITYCHSMGIKVNTWTVNDERIAKHLENCGIDFITSDKLGA